MKVKHTIIMVEKNGDAKVTYKNVIGYEGLYGCLTQLNLEDGATATFNNDEWLMFDLTATKGWNENAVEI